MLRRHNKMACLIAQCLVVLCVTIVYASAGVEITPSRLFINEGDKGNFTCPLQIPKDRSCFRTMSWHFANVSGIPMAVAGINMAMDFGQFAEHFVADYHERNAYNGGNFKKCVYFLEIYNATTDFAGQYHCQFNKQMSDPASVIVVPRPETIQPECDIRVSNITHLIQKVELRCKAYPVDPVVPAIELAWLYQGRKMESTNFTSDLGILTSKSNVTPRNESSEEMTFTCRMYASNKGGPLGNSCSITCEVTISLHGSMGNESGRPEGTFQCPFKMSLEGIQYRRRWMLDGELIDLGNQSDRFIAEDHTGTLHMTEMLETDNGKTLTCEVITMFGVYSAETLIKWGEVSTGDNGQKGGPVLAGFELSMMIIVIIAAGLALLFIINVFVCMVVVKSRGRRSRTMSQQPGGAVADPEQNDALYASGIIPSTGYLHMNGIYTGSYDPEEPYQAMKAEDLEGCTRDSHYQVPKVKADGSAIKKKQSVKYVNTMGGGGAAARSKGFVFRFSRRKERKLSKSGGSGSEAGACGGEGDGMGPPVSPNCYAAPRYSCDTSLQVPQITTEENQYDELKVKSQDASEE